MPLPRNPVDLLARTPGSRWGEVPGLSEKRRRAIEKINRRKAKIVKQAHKIAEFAMRAPQIADGDPCPEGWTEEEWRIASDARKPKRDAPVYLEFAKAVTAAAEKADKEPQVQSLNIGSVNIVQAPVYETIDISETDKK